MLGPSECQVSCGSAVSLQWTEGEDGTLTLEISHSDKSPGGIRRSVQTGETSSWNYAEKVVSNTNTICFQAASASIANETRDAHHQVKIRNKWASTVETLNNFIVKYYKNPSTFFGVISSDSREEFSYLALEESRNEMHRYRNPFHRINLALAYEEGLRRVKEGNPHFLEQNYRTTYLKGLHPGYTALNRKKRGAVAKRFGRNIDQGKQLCQLSQNTPGLLLTVGSILSREE
jgi:hypothetical protein